MKGLSFNAGSKTASPTKYVSAIEACNLVIKQMTLSTLDIGGGFLVPYSKDLLPIDEFC
ncbi:hypothetical protein NDQ71_20415 [Pseudoalteromonas sp. KG3]|uniref:hypothetical protein n=1 Tax=Pseudoalteromonas prydzensis TaxID=182141 RepID=UPI002657CEE2|nr:MULTISPECIES: hypothetical protein [Pseudoalteromonas]WKD26294.1 hypothetical protein NDQ71_20415 [Pseudoalteromonas sp. KG3]